MFRRGGPSFQSQGTGITSPFDTPRRGLVQHPGGYAGKTIEELAIEKEEIFAPKPYENINDIIGSFAGYASPYKEDGTAMTTGEMGYRQAKDITALRKEREEKRQLAALTGLEKEEESLAIVTLKASSLVPSPVTFNGAGTDSTSTSPISTPLLAANLPIAALPACNVDCTAKVPALVTW